ncbi:MAG: ABC-type multidrug transport system, ATPase component [Clostridia bacterium]|nr:ABC-type multidrug transport system, ATPase component [Clostridia bacterium]
MSTIEIKNITKRFNNVLAVDNISAIIEENKIYGLLGRNGAGKSTLLKMITNNIFPTSGEIFIDGDPVLENDRTLSKVYCMTEKNLYPERMKIKDSFKWSKEFYPNFNMDYAKGLSEKFALKLNKNIRELSTGYSSIFKVIIALSCNAPIILLDEPLLGLDANHRDLFYKELLQNYLESPKTFVISTHLIEEASDIISEVMILDNGKVILNDNIDNINEKGYTISGKASSIDNFITGKNVIGIDTLGGLKTAYIFGNLDKKTITPDIEVSKLNLQKLFIKLTNSSNSNNTDRSVNQ